MDESNQVWGRLFLFNCGNEAALIHQDRAGYTPRSVVRQMRRDLAYLSAWLSDSPETDFVYLPLDAPEGEVSCPFLLPRPLRLSSKIESLPSLHLDLWGPEPTLRPLFEQLRTAYSEVYVSPYWTQSFPLFLFDRSLSHDFLQWINFNPDQIPRLCRSVEELDAVCRGGLQGEWLSKLPFSSSGRGILPYEFPLSPHQREALKRQLYRNGMISLEPRLDKVADWASEFMIEADGSVRFVGLSHFETEGFRYLYNKVCQPSLLWTKLAEEVGTDYLQEVIDRQLQFLCNRIAPYYRGAVGVDMITYREGENIRLHPAIEINVRTTMGFLAHQLYARVGAPNLFYHFEIKSFSHKGDAKQWIHGLEKANPSCWNKDNQLISGTLVLHPVDDQSLFVAVLSCQ